MNIRRTAHIIKTSLTRAAHRRGFGIQSPWAYELIRDVLFEPLPYYAYQEEGLTTPLEQQLYRIRNHYHNHPIIVIEEKGEAANIHYEQALQTITPDTIIVIEHTHNDNANLWSRIVQDPRAIITFDMRRRGMITFDSHRIKQNYLL
ncbi:MAG: hypothetical protein J5924_01030 [Bacteroidaceae bacterium]|jgi:hypothetical protein|nr:hypothetical protein [Bacteroidaceae bacterium]